MKLFTLVTLHTRTPKIIKNKFLLAPEKGRKAVILNWETNEKDYIDLSLIVSPRRMITSSGVYELRDTSGLLKFLTTRVKSQLENILTEAQYQDQAR